MKLNLSLQLGLLNILTIVVLDDRSSVNHMVSRGSNEFHKYVKTGFSSLTWRL